MLLTHLIQVAELFCGDLGDSKKCNGLGDSEVAQPTRLLQTIDSFSSELDKQSANGESDRERDVFLEAIAGYSIFLGMCLSLRFGMECLLKKCRAGRPRPDKLTFPRLELQAVSITIPPLTFASTRLLAVGTPEALQLGLLGLIVLVAPFTIWYICILVIRNLILKPEIYIEHIMFEDSHLAALEPIFEKTKEQLTSTASGDLIGVVVEAPEAKESNILPKMLPPHEAAIDDYVNEIEHTLRTRISAASHTDAFDINASNRKPKINRSRIHPTLSEGENASLLRSQRLSTAPTSKVEIELAEGVRKSHKETVDSARDYEMAMLDRSPSDRSPSPKLILRELHPEKLFLKKFGFVIDDVIGDEPLIAQHRLKPQFLLTHAIFFLHKVLAAAIFGLTIEKRRSFGQVMILVIFQLILVLHLVIVRPYIFRSVLSIELIVNSFEFVIFAGSGLLLFEIAVDTINLVMIVCFLSATIVMGLYELRHMSALINCRRCRKM